MIGNAKQERSELITRIVAYLLDNQVRVCVMDNLYPESIYSVLRSAGNPTAYASLSHPAVLAILPSGDVIWIYVYVSRTKQPRIPLEPILYTSALDVYGIDSLHIVRWRGKEYGLLLDDVFRAMDKVLIPRASADYWENEREYVACALLPTDVPTVYDDDVRGACVQLLPSRMSNLPDWQLQLDVCLAECVP